MWETHVHASCSGGGHRWAQPWEEEEEFCVLGAIKCTVDTDLPRGQRESLMSYENLSQPEFPFLKALVLNLPSAATF